MHDLAPRDAMMHAAYSTVSVAGLCTYCAPDGIRVALPPHTPLHRSAVASEVP